MNYFFAEFKRAIQSKNFLIANFLILGSLIVGMISSWSSIRAFKGISFFLYSFSLGTGAILPVVVPLIVCLPFSNSYLQEIENNMIYGIVTRISIKKYYYIKCLTLSLVAALTIIIPLLFFLLTNALIFQFEKGVYFGEIGGAWSSVFKENQLAYVMILIANSAIFAATYANVGFVATFFSHHKLASIVIPFILYLLPSFIFPFIGFDKFEPVTTFDLTSNTSSTIFTVYSQLIIIILLGFSLGYLKLKKELVTYGSNDD